MATVEKVQNKDGSVSWRVRFEVGTSDDRRRRSKTFPCGRGATRKEIAAVKLEADLFARSVERDGVEAVEAERLTFAQLAERYMAARSSRWTGSSVRMRETALRLHILPVIGHRPVRSVRAMELDDWMRAQEAMGASAASIRQRWSVISAVFRQAVEWRLSPWNPCEGVQPPAQAKARERVLSREEEAAFVAAIRGDAWEWFWRVMLYGGLRLGEASALRWCDVDWDGSAVVVGRTVTLGADHVARIREGTKTHETARTLRPGRLRVSVPSPSPLCRRPTQPHRPALP